MFMPDQRLHSELDLLLATAQVDQRMPSVSACVFRDGEILWERVLGVADVPTSRPATADDVYRIGSITKTFTAVLVMQLVDAERLELDAPLRTYLPEAPVGPTIRMALSHLTGLQREPPGEIWESMEPPSREELIAGLEDAELVLRPAEQWHYVDPYTDTVRDEPDPECRGSSRVSSSIAASAPEPRYS